MFCWFNWSIHWLVWIKILKKEKRKRSFWEIPSWRNSLTPNFILLELYQSVEYFVLHLIQLLRLPLNVGRIHAKQFVILHSKRNQVCTNLSDSKLAAIHSTLNLKRLHPSVKAGRTYHLHGHGSFLEFKDRMSRSFSKPQIRPNMRNALGGSHQHTHLSR